MKKLALPLAILAALCFVGITAAPADAGGFSISLGGHGGYQGSVGHGYSSYYPSYSTSYGHGGSGWYGSGWGYSGGYGGGHGGYVPSYSYGPRFGH